MIEYFRLAQPESDRLYASTIGERRLEAQACSIVRGIGKHSAVRRRWGAQLALEVRHNDRDQWLIPQMEGMVAHARLLAEFEKRGFTGYRLIPASVRFRDGYVSKDYSELVVTGWAGVSPPESGIVVTNACTNCGNKKYSSLANPEKLIDWSQWTGEDFFIVWPLPMYTLITKRVADVLAEVNVKSYRLESMLKREQGPFAMNLGYGVGALSGFLPQDLANKYGEPLSLECQRGCWPDVESIRNSHQPTADGDAGIPLERLR